SRWSFPPSCRPRRLPRVRPARDACHAWRAARRAPGRTTASGAPPRVIRSAIASLEDDGIHSVALDAVPTLSAAVIPVAQPAKLAETIDPTSTLSNTATLRLLESGAAVREPSRAPAPTAAAAPAPAAAAIRGADDTVVAQASAASTPRPEKPWYAVQLVWSVQPIDMAQ